MALPPATPPSCPPPGENSFYHLKTNPEDSLCTRIFRIIAYVILHILTFGLLLLIHYCRNHVIEDQALPIIPVISAPEPEPRVPPPSPKPPRPGEREVLEAEQQPLLPPQPLPLPPTATVTAPQEEEPQQAPKETTKDVTVLPAPLPVPDVTEEEELPAPEEAPQVSPPEEAAVEDLPPAPAPSPIVTPPLFPTPPDSGVPSPEAPQPAPPPKKGPTIQEIAATIRSLGQLPPGVIANSLEAMVHAKAQGITPTGARLTISPHETLNPLFIATYPSRVSDVFAYMMSSLQEQVLRAPPEAESTQVAHLLLAQLKHLDASYYIIDVPGDGNCFYRSCYIGWLASLQRLNSPNAFLQEAERILQLPFANSSTENRLLSQNMAAILRQSQNQPTMQALYDNILLSFIHTPKAISYLRNLALHTVSEQRVTRMGGEANVRALLLGQMAEAPEMLVDLIQELSRTQPSGPILSNIFKNEAIPITSASDQLLLVMEFLSQLLLSDRDLARLPEEERQKQVQFQAYLDELVELCATILASSNIDNASVNATVANLSPEILAHYNKFLTSITAARPNSQLPSAVLFLAFVLMHPSCVTNNPVCASFHRSVKDTLQGVYVSPEMDLAGFLGWRHERAARLNEALQKCWTQKQSASLVEQSLGLCDGFKSARVIPQLQQAYTLIAKLMKNTPRSYGLRDLQQLQHTILSHIQQSPSLSASYVDFVRSPIFKPLDQLITSAAPLDKAYAEGIKIFFFLLQYPTLLQNPHTSEAAKQLMLIFQPHLQQALRKRVNSERITSMGGSIFGILSCSPPKEAPIFPDVAAIEATVLFAAKDPVVLAVSTPNLRTPLFHITRAKDQQVMAALLNEVKTQYPQPWAAFIHYLDIVGHKSTAQNANSPFSTTLPNDLLLLSFLKRHPNLLANPSDLNSRLSIYLAEQELQIKNEIITQLALWIRIVGENYSFLSSYINAQKAFLFSLVRSNTAYPEVCQSLVYQLQHVSTQQLSQMFDSVNTQAEDEHVAAISSVLGPLALCQYLADATLTQTPAQLAPLAATQGFLQTDYASEDQARICVFRANNHYNCLLRKEPSDTSLGGNPNPPQS
ncbi:hypothetical protein [Chlamydia vaughanii]|uniref:hypothetical protein n=1 Tax=Chlamydia vaughanii TaxID=3112552 RepID=UPI0032B27F46